MATVDLIAHILLLGASVVALALMLWRDARGLQQCRFSSADFYKLITDREEYMTVPRIVLLVVLVASATVMAMASGYVVLLLAVAVLAVDVAVWRSRPRQGELSARARRLLAVTLVVLLVVAVAVALTSGLYYCAVAALGMAVFSYAPALAVNWLMSLVERCGKN